MKLLLAIIISILMFSCTESKDSKESKTDNVGKNIEPDRTSIHQQDREEAHRLDSYKNKYKINIVSDTKLTDVSIGRFTNPKFSSDGNVLVFSTIDMNEIWSYNLENKNLKKIIELPGCGRNFCISENDEIYFINIARKGNIRTGGVYSIMSYSVTSEKLEVIYKTESRITNLIVVANEIFFLENDIAKCYDLLKNELSNNANAPFYFVQDNYLIKAYPNQDTVNFGKANPKIISAEYSHDNEFLYILTANNGIIIYDLLEKVFNFVTEAVRVSKLNNSNLIVYNKEVYEGDRVVNSDLFLGFIDNNISIKFDNPQNELRFNPKWAPKENMVVYNTADNEIKLITFNIDIESK